MKTAPIDAALADELHAEHRAAIDRASAAFNRGDMTAYDVALDRALEVIDRAAVAGLNLVDPDTPPHRPDCDCALCWSGPPRCVFINTRAERVPEGDDGRPSLCVALQCLINSRAPWSDATVAIDGGIMCFECGDAWALFCRRRHYMDESEARALAVAGR